LTGKEFQPVLLFALITLTVLSGCEKGKTGVHPDFNITKRDITSVTDKLPHDIRSNIIKNPQCFLEYMERILNEPVDYAVLVDKKHALSSSYIPPDLVNIREYGLRTTKKYLRIRRIVIPDLTAMAEAARLQGVELVIGSSYRSYAYQKQLYSYYVRTEGKEKADKESARPGHSQHQLGTTMDFSPIDNKFIETKGGKWLDKYAWKYGFSLSYPPDSESITGYKYEPWHYRYVGRDVSFIIKRYFDGKQQLFLEFYDKTKEYFKKSLRK